MQSDNLPSSSTCDPDDFIGSAGYSLRQKQYGRKTDLLICMTYYNESRELVAVRARLFQALNLRIAS